MPRQKVEKTLRPSGVRGSANGKYFYWYCTVSGLETFADVPRFKDVVAKFGSEENLVKKYVLRPVQKYVDAGYSPERIKGIIKANGGKKIPAIDAKEKAQKAAIKIARKKAKGPRKKGLKSFAVGEIEVPTLTPSGSVEIVAERVYPWTNNPDYFSGGPPAPVNIEESSRLICYYPNRRLDDLCHGCSIYDRCNCTSKIQESDRHLSKYRKEEVKITQIHSWHVDEEY